ncbi:TRIM56 [Mytilus edulis]|nr:TRIM56 [Mytilus edulis]
MLKGEVLPCPMCKTEYLLPSEGIYVFPKDATRRNLIEFLRVRKRSSDIICKDCPDDNIASEFCKECYIFMCLECTRAHRRSLASRNHAVLSVEQLQKQGPEIFKRRLKCNKQGHEGQHLSFYCAKKGCEKMICTSCTVCDHDKNRGHIIQNMNDVHVEKKHELDKIFRMLEEDVKIAKELHKQTEQEMVNLDIKEFEVEQELDDAVKRCHDMIERRREDLREKVAILTDAKKSSLRARAEQLESFIQGVTGAREFSENIMTHTDVSEFVPLHTTLYRRLKVLTKHHVKKTMQIESPAFEPTRMEGDFHRFVKGMGNVTTVTHNKQLCTTRGHSDVSLASLRNTQAEGDVRHGEITCPNITFDSNTVHQYRDVSEDGKTLKNQSIGGQRLIGSNERRLKNYRGAISSRPLKGPGKFYFEVLVDFQITKPLDNVNFVFEIGFSRRHDVDIGHYVYDQSTAWSFCAQQCDEHKQLCQWCRHNGRNLAHAPLSSASAGTVSQNTYGFLLETEQKRITVYDCTFKKKFYTFHNVDVSRPIWPVFGCHWPSKVKIDITLKTGADIVSIPNYMRTSSTMA